MVYKRVLIAWKFHSKAYRPLVLLSTSSPGKPNLFFPKSGPTGLKVACLNFSLLLLTNSMDEDKDSEDEGTAYSANVSMLLPVSQLKELLPPVTRNCQKALTYSDINKVKTSLRQVFFLSQKYNFLVFKGRTDFKLLGKTVFLLH